MSLLHRTKHATAPETAEPAAEVAPAETPATDDALPSLWSWLDAWGPGIEEHREAGELVIRLEMPGLDPDEVDITVSDGVLRIRAEHREEVKDEETGYRSEVRCGSYARTMTLPAGATEDDVKASYREGVLEVHVPVDDRTTGATKVPIATT